MPWTGKQIRALRQQLGWSLADLSSRLGVTVETLDDWEKGRTEPANTVNQNLVRIRAFAESHARRVSRNPLVDSLLGERGLDQIPTHNLDSED